jgi:hypothetical protein
MTDSTKTCPWCAEEILIAALKCKHCGSMVDPDSGGSVQSESILTDYAANLFRGVEAVGGRLRISTCRLIFESHKVNLQKTQLEILMSDIQSIEKKRVLGIAPTGLHVTTKGGKTYKFVSHHRDEIIRHIQPRITG